MSIKNAKYKLKNNIMIKPEILRFLWDIVVFRLVAYLLNMIQFSFTVHLSKTYTVCNENVNKQILNAIAEEL